MKFVLMLFLCLSFASNANAANCPCGPNCPCEQPCRCALGCTCSLTAQEATYGDALAYVKRTGQPVSLWLYDSTRGHSPRRGFVSVDTSKQGQAFQRYFQTANRSGYQVTLARYGSVVHATMYQPTRSVLYRQYGSSCSSCSSCR